MSIPFANTYTRLPAEFYHRMAPAAVAGPAFVALNRELAQQLKIDPEWLQSSAGLAVMAGNTVAEGAEPLALAYAGHQFGHWVPQLGDGRALLLGEVVDQSGVRRDLQLKGSGPTPFSRGGDGRSSIGPVVREYLACEAMAALGIPTTRALAAVMSEETVVRQQPEPGGILCRVASSHVRVGTFEYFARNGRPDAVQALADYVIERHYPELSSSSAPYADLLDRVIDRTAYLVAAWMLVGFIHGVMNTDNTSVVGETIDFGPFGYLDAYDPATVYSSIDRYGRYAYNQQPAVVHWNLARLTECLLPLLADDEQAALDCGNELLSQFQPYFDRYYHAGLAQKLGLEESRQDDDALALALLDCMAEEKVDMTLCFRRLSDLSSRMDEKDGHLYRLFRQSGSIKAWLQRWRSRLTLEARSDHLRQQAMRSVNPAFVLRNHLAQRAADAAVQELDFSPLRELQQVLTQPYEELPGYAHLYEPPVPEERVLQTFCGT